MNLIAVIKSMDFRQLWSLFWLCLRHLRFVLPTIKATRKTVTICDELYGDRHHRNGPENAVRHALWNILIAFQSVQRGLPLQRSLAWAKTITDWHEDFSPNEPLARAMDLHNNRVGRDVFDALPNECEEYYVAHLLKMFPLSRKRTNKKQFAGDKGILVHIEDVF